MKTLDRLLILLLIISIAISVYFFTVKITVEQQNNNVEISVPLKEIDMLSKITRMKSEAIIDKLKTSGMTSIAVEEYTLRDITELGRAIILNGWQLADNLRFIGTDSPLIKDLISEQNLDMNSYYVLTREPDIFKKTMNAMIARGYQIRTFEDQTEGLYIIQEVKGDGFFSSIGLGFDRSQFDLVKVSGLNTIAYAKQLQDKSPDEIADLTSSILDVDASVLIFQDNQVPKDPESRQLLINFFKANDSTLGFDEFISTNNISQFIKDIDYNAARVYNRPQHKWMDEYLIATRDRNDRILYLHLFLSGQDDMLTYNAKHIAEIKDEIISRGITNRFNFGNAKPFKAFSFNKLFSFAASFGILWGIWRLLSLCKSARQFKIKTIVLIFIIFIGLAIFDFSIFRNIAGLTAAVCFPVLTYNIMLSTVYGGLVLGLGLGIVFKAGGSTGGSDLAAILINHFVPSVIFLSCNSLFPWTHYNPLETALAKKQLQHYGSLLCNLMPQRSFCVFSPDSTVLLKHQFLCVLELMLFFVFAIAVNLIHCL
jgi:hypothetical protein